MLFLLKTIWELAKVDIKTWGQSGHQKGFVVFQTRSLRAALQPEFSVLSDRKHFHQRQVGFRMKGLSTWSDRLLDCGPRGLDMDVPPFGSMSWCPQEQWGPLNKGQLKIRLLPPLDGASNRYFLCLKYIWSLFFVLLFLSWLPFLIMMMT